SIVVIDLKDCFFTISLVPEDAQWFAFSVQTVNRQAPVKRFHWSVLPQGMKNSPTMCQLYVAKALSEIRRKYPHIICYHYMDNSLFSGPTPTLLAQVVQDAR
ncbi:POK8 protein, partial [Rynchops niger]|nr:POK8 protein [Rynchops niger]